MVASRQVEIPIFRGVGRQRGQGFDALAQVIGRTAIQFLRKYVVPAAKRVAANLLEFAAPEIEKIVSSTKIFKTAERVWEDRLWENNWVVVAGRGFQAESCQQKNLQNKPVGLKQTFS